MKRVLLAIVTCISITGIASENEIKVKSKITEATVFLSGAQVTSEANSSIGAGTSEIVFENLSPSINVNTIQAKGEGNFSILSVVHRLNYLNQQPKPKELTTLEDSLEILNNALDLQRGLKNVYANEESMILSNKSIGGDNNGVTALEFEKIANIFRTRLIDLNTKQLEIKQKEKKLTETITRITNQIYVVQQGRSKSTSEIVVTVSAKAATMGKIDVSYLVYGAGWTPSYDIRAKDSNSPIALAYKGNVYQSSGFDWKNVKLTLSTGNPNVSGSKPILNPWWLKFYNPYSYGNDKKKARSYNSAPQMEAPTYLDEISIASEEGTFKEAAGKAAGSLAQYVEVGESATTTEYNIEIPYSIPSDGKHYIVEIQNLSIPAMYSYYCAPKIDNDAFLLAKITGWDKYNLISGDANIFFEDTYVGKSYLNTISTNDTMDISLGRDKNVTVTRTKLVDFCEKKVIGLNKKETSTYEISIRNKKKDAIEIIVEDQIPLSSNNEIVVEATETGKAEYDKVTGKLMWKLKMAPAETQKFKFGYTVKYPKDKILTNL